MLDVESPELVTFAREVREFISEPDKSRSVENLTPNEFLDYWLKYQGIIGYTSDIVRLIEALGWKQASR